MIRMSSLGVLGITIKIQLPTISTSIPKIELCTATGTGLLVILNNPRLINEC